jgi:DNA-binding NtrC family response regulator
MPFEIARSSSSPPATTSPDRILIVDDDEELLEVLANYLRVKGFVVDTAMSYESALPRFEMAPPSAALIDVRLPGRDGFDFLERARELSPTVPVVLLSGYGGLDDVMRASAAGAADYLVKPVDAQQLVGALLRVLADRAVPSEALEVAPLRPEATSLTGGSAAVEAVRSVVRRAAPTSVPILITGETGVGKEVLARAVHEASGRRGEFVAVNCAALPEGLIESALFGHERGAFTGAIRREIGAFERAHRGTILLDEVTEMRTDLQAKLLRVLQEGSIERVGGNRRLQLDVRVIATSNRDIETAVRIGVLRQDLRYRLDAVGVNIPPLRERPEDIPELVQELLRDAAQRFGVPIPTVSPDAMRMLQSYSWPGNVRQLLHTLHRACIFADADGIVPSLLNLPPAPGVHPGRESGLPAVEAAAAHDGTLTGRAASPLPTLRLADLERLAIREALAETRGNRSRAAAVLGINVRSLRRILNEAGVVA